MTAFDDLAKMVEFRPMVVPLPGDGLGSQFTASWSATIELLSRELRLVGAEHAIMEIDFRSQDLRQDGLPRVGRSARTPGLRLSFVATKLPRKPALRYEVGRWRTFEENLRALALGLEHLRANGRYGFSKNGEQYEGYRQLTSGSSEIDKAARGRAIIAEHAGDVRAALAATHPDRGGNPEDFDAVMAARG